MRKRFATLVGTLASLVLLYCLLFTALQVTMNSDLFLEQEYKKLNLSKSMGMTNSDIIASTRCLCDYMEGKVDSIDIMVTVNGEETLMFTDKQEISHMADVRTLYQTFRNYRDYGLLLALILYLIAAIISVRTAPHSIAKGYTIAALLVVAFGVFIGTWGLLDFTSFWTFFHTTLFWNNDWLFDPATSRMINILPEQFFSDIIIAFAIVAVLMIGVLLVISLLLLHGEQKRKKAAREEYIAAKKAKRENKLKVAQAEKAAAADAGKETPAASAAAPAVPAEEEKTAVEAVETFNEAQPAGTDAAEQNASAEAETGEQNNESAPAAQEKSKAESPDSTGEQQDASSNEDTETITETKPSGEAE